ncbi:MAG: hypothetical protein ACOH1Y_13995 [Propionicimonas sp.]
MIPLERSGTFTLGCNYWASHAGTRMWRDWRPAVVERDLAALAAAGLTTLRVFPLWSDFQPVTAVRGFGGVLEDLRLTTPEQGEQPLPDTPVGQAGVDELMLGRFAEFCGIAERHGLDLIVGLITGWMSGRVFCPPVLEGRALHTDPLALQLQGRFIRTFVTRFRSTAPIVAWDLGNECNCLGIDTSREAAWTWTAFVTQAIRTSDSTRPVISGMHSLLPSPELSSGWTIQDQAEHTDLLTTHPYPMWSRHTDQDPLDTIRTTLHATAETRMYADIGGKPCFVEEIGTMGPMMGDWQVASDFLRCNLFSLWANDCRGLLWWCAFDQTRLSNAPYDALAVERELGLLDEDHRPKPMLTELTRFAELVPSLPANLPERHIDAACILTHGQDAWAAAYSAWVLATQAKITLRFAWAEAPLPDADVYFLPSLSGVRPIRRPHWEALLARVAAGASLHVTLGDGILEPFSDVFGVRVRSRSERTTPTPFTLPTGERLTAHHGPDLRLAVEPGTEVLASADDGTPMVTRRAYGSGQVTLTAVPVETQLTATPGGFHSPEAEPWHALYRLLTVATPRPIDSDSPELAVTLHGDRYAVLINHGNAAAVARFAPGVTPVHWLHGSAMVAGHHAAIVEFVRSDA